MMMQDERADLHFVIDISAIARTAEDEASHRCGDILLIFIAQIFTNADRAIAMAQQKDGFAGFLFVIVNHTINTREMILRGSGAWIAIAHGWQIIGIVEDHDIDLAA